MNQSGFTREERSDFIKSQILGGIGAITLGLGLYGLFAADDPFHPVFTNRDFDIALLTIGGLFLVTEWFILWPVLKARMRRLQQSGDGT